jgi:hypothetical protein
MKKTLLIAAAALMAGVISSQAQVYSANIVGYVNVVFPAGQYVGAANPLDLDTVNSVTNVFAGVPKGTAVLTWNGAAYTTLTKNAVTGAWPAAAATTLIPPGVGFLVKSPSAYTNTFVGNVIPNSPGVNNTPLPAGLYTFVGSVTPLSGVLTDAGTNTLNLGASLPKGSQVLVWNGSGYQTATKNAVTGVWNTNLSIAVAEGMLVKPASATNWVQYFQSN